jgi:dCTP deaminase
MILSDRDLIVRKEELITPFDERFVQPSSYDLALSEEFLIPKKFDETAKIDIRYDDPSALLDKFTAKEFILKPGMAVLGCTKEYVRCPKDLSARVEGKSTLGRLFLAVHVTAGVVDAGFEGQITLEIVNLGPWDIVLYEDMKIAQLSYFNMTSGCMNAYGSKKLKSHYNGQTGPTPASGRRALEK